MSTDPLGRPYGTYGPAGPGRRPGPRSRRTWYLAVAATAVLGLAAGGVALLVGGHGAPRRQVAAGCGLINCGADLPSPAVTASTQSHTGKAHTHVSHVPAAPAQQAPPSQPPPAPLPSPAPTSAAPAPTNVAVSFMPDRDRRDFHHFQDQMTLLNRGGSPVSGWTVQLTLPGDGVDSVDSQGGGWDGVPFDHWQFSGDTLTISAGTGSEALGPGAPLNLSIHGRGDMTSPTGCTFNGAACTFQDPGRQFWQQAQPGGQARSTGQQAGQQIQQQGWHDQRPGQQEHQSWWQHGQRSWGDQPKWGWRR